MELGVLMQQYRAGGKHALPGAIIPMGTSDAQKQTLLIDLTTHCSAPGSPNKAVMGSNRLP